MKNRYATQLVMKKQAEFIEWQRFIRQLSADIAEITLNRVYGIGKERMVRFAEEYAQLYNEVITAWNQDAEGREYTKDLVDRGLKQIFGDSFIPWEERYDFKIPR